MKRTKGSALVLTLILVVAATTAVLALTGLASSTSKAENRRELELRMKYSFEGAVAKAERALGDETLAVGGSTSITCDGITWAVTVTDYGATIAKSLKIDGTTTYKSKTYARSTVCGNPYAKTPFKYVLVGDGGATFPKAINTGPPGKGSVYANNIISASVAGTIDGSLTTTAASPPANLTVTGTTKLNAAPLMIVSPNEADYIAAKTSTIGASTLSGVTFVQPYELWYRNGNLNIEGVISGTGTIYVYGSVTISDDLTYANASSCVAIICSGNIDIPIGATNIVGYFFCEGNVKFDKILAVTFGPGALVHSGNLNTNVALTMTFDDRVKKSEKMGYDLKLPGYWP